MVERPVFHHEDDDVFDSRFGGYGKGWRGGRSWRNRIQRKAAGEAESREAGALQNLASRRAQRRSTGLVGLAGLVHGLLLPRRYGGAP
jgi:hypothetical protein